MINFTEIKTGEDWELFSRDFFTILEYYIEQQPNRGADGGKDFIILENIKGKLNSYSFRWLVSCKHFSKSGKSVNENDDEKNILERVKSFKADGFIGFYSTIASSGLHTRLQQLKDGNEIKDFRIFDNKIIESNLLNMGYSQLIMRYLPEAYKKIKPIHLMDDEYIPLKCDHCGKDLLTALYSEDEKALIARASKLKKEKHIVHDIYFACKGKCDRNLDEECRSKYDTITSWEDITDLARPNFFLFNIMSLINRLNDQNYIYTEKAFKKEKKMIMAIAQKVFREATDFDKTRFNELVRLIF